MSVPRADESCAMVGDQVEALDAGEVKTVDECHGPTVINREPTLDQSRRILRSGCGHWVTFDRYWVCVLNMERNIWLVYRGFSKSVIRFASRSSFTSSIP